MGAWDSHVQVDLNGNRVVGETASAWSVIKAMGRAFPLLLDKSIQRSEGLGLSEEEACLAWAKQVSCPPSPRYHS